MQNDMTDKRGVSIHIRVSDESDAVLDLMSQAHQRTKADIAAELVEEALLGRGHSLRIAALRYARLGFAAKPRERQE